MFRVIFACLLASMARAGVERVGTTAAAFTKLGSGARPAALGEAFVALADDASGIAYNPAGMSQMLAGELQATHTEWFRGLKYENLNGVFSLGDGGMVGATFNFLAVPSLTRTEQVASTPDPSLNFREIGSFTPFDLQAALAYSRPLYPGLLGGVNLKMLSQSIDDRSTIGLGLDLGGILQTGVKGLTVGLAVQNLGTPIKLKREAFELPWVVRAGAAWKLFNDSFTVLAETDLPSDNAMVFSAGLEYSVSDKFYPRFGYRYNSIFNPWSVGLGVKFSQAFLDLAIVPFGELGLTYRGSLGYRFGQPSASLESPLPYLNSLSNLKPAILVPRVAAPDKVTAWALYIYDSGRPSQVVRQIQGRGALESQILWDGKLKDGTAAREGVYHAILSARYTTGKVVYTKYLRLEVNNTPPQVELTLDPISVNPHASGEAYIPTSFKASLKSGRAAAAWRFEILDSQGAVFRTLRGQGPPPESLVWDGKGEAGEALISGRIYQARLWVIDPLGNEAQSQSPVAYRAVFR